LIRIFPCDYTYTYQFVIFKKVKSVLKMKTKKIKKGLNTMWHGGRDLPPWRLAAGPWHRAAPPYRQKCYPAAVPHSVRDLTPWGTAA
jgi:hypothetical protein